VSHPDAMPPVRRELFTVLGIMLVAIAFACGSPESDDTSGESAAASGASVAAACSPGGRIDSMSRTAIVTWAGHVRYLPASPTLAYVYGFAAADSVRIQAAEERSGRACVIARLTSGRAFPTIGIARGDNYVFAESLATGYKAMIIAADSAVPITVHSIALHAHVEGGAPPDPVGLLGSCIQSCGVGGRTWCRLPFDSTRAESYARPLDLERLRSPGRVPPR
jgi:hypothetical protein